ncbi:MAG: hypothetical protein N3E36_04695 [Sulfolobales archaeon]|nr:hypothetical protein [Sulfolobales archaeon]MCX8199314.1 hypothetical protein [Sulfolobales archaeon]MDW8170372.1 hypothetical protein [Desulfurococcaceae archaeon]
MKFKYSLNKPYDLMLTLLPSFTYPLFSERRGVLIKDYGYCKGMEVQRIESSIIVSGCSNEEFINEVLGLWYDPLNYLNDVSYSFKNLIEELAWSFRKIRLSISTMDRWLVFTACFLSRATNYYSNTVKWVRAIASVNLDSIGEVDLTNVSTSFQVRQLSYLLKNTDILEAIVEVSNDLSELINLRRRLLRYPFIGVKTVDAYLLFSTKLPIFTPVDRHYRSFAKEFLGLKEYVEPRKDLCSNYYCWKCPRRSRCLTWFSMNSFGRLSGWIQTIAYLNSKTNLIQGSWYRRSFVK